MTQRYTSASADELTKIGDEFFDATMVSDPLGATMFGIPGYDHLVPDPSARSDEARISGLEGLERRLDKITGLTPADELSAKVLRRLISSSAGELRHGLMDVAVSGGLIAPQTQVFRTVPMSVLGDDRSGRAYLDRLRGLEFYFDGWSERYRIAVAAGRLPTRRGVRQAVEQLDTYLSSSPTDDVLVRPAAGHAEHSQAEALITDIVRPAVGRLRARLAEAMTAAREDDKPGICHVPGGPEGYAEAVTRHTTTTLSPEEVHRIGLDAVERLRQEFADIGGPALGTTSVPEILEKLRTSRELRFSTSEEILRFADGALVRANGVLPGWFFRYDIGACETREIGPLEAKTSPLAYYQPPAEDGSRPGVHWVSTVDPHSRFRYEYEALTFHESVPGHHFQIGLAQTLDHLPRFRRVAVGNLTAHVEGWGLYAERLADEMGLYSSPIQRLGMVSFDALRACRLVVDTGMHHLGWTRGQAIAYMRENTATTEANIANEVDRYISWPGQALAYFVGRREIHRLRDLAKAELGKAFDIKQFHHQVIGHGSLPLDVLGDVIRTWIADRRRA
ncbi:DUF885 domain-containing protein [Saccharopolyspora spinosa]|uniref:Uncharacterized protein (DUF885 family) n=1 Tax=Saccharopolyspora spinosa TaxID=60894 RepID=A0A2N3Y8D0_SACSN|nr:DUF885 domain-containing protein [Saccharopolyspora spinosa]PKW19179.1 uncharacterized protein (DUF885 family) [Saccharopolyspora spinosa]